MQTDERALWARYRETGDRAARNALAEQYLHLAHAVARRFLGRGAEAEDLTQVASLALLEAIERFDTDKGLMFTTFAVPTLAGVVRNHLRDKAQAVRLPRRDRELLVSIERQRELCFRASGREPTVAELAEALAVRMDDVLGALETGRVTRMLSLDEPPADGEDGTLASLLGGEDEAFGRVEQVDAAVRLLSLLDGSARLVIEERFLRGRSQREVARTLGVSQMQVSRLERRALGVLRERLAADV
ncbi:hypothetical protein FACS1894196_3420 [Clostridia bacterium]|nr:hypothetical protein FACS1894196_3420 [Clostridia bacterium]